MSIDEREMNKREQFRYLFDYYLIKPIAVCLAAGLLIWSVWHFLHPAPQTVIYAVVYDLQLDADVKTELSAVLAEYYGEEITPDQIILDDSFRSDSVKDIERVQVLAANHAVDAVISPDLEIMKGYAAYGYLRDLTEVMGEESEKAADKKEVLISAPGMLWSDEISFEDHESGRGPEKPYILDISKTETFLSLTDGAETQGYLGAVAYSSHEGGAEILIECFLDGRSSCYGCAVQGNEK